MAVRIMRWVGLGGLGALVLFLSGCLFLLGGCPPLPSPGVGSVYSFGNGGHGQLGHGDSDPRLDPTKIAGLPGTAIAVAAGHSHSLVILENGDVFSFGYNDFGQLGQGDLIGRLVPTKILGLPGPAVGAAAGEQHSLILLANGDVYSCGANPYGQLGHGDHVPRLVPTRIASLPGPAVAVAAGSFHSLVILANGDIFSFGENSSGQLGVGDSQPRNVPTKIEGLPSPAVAADGGLDHSLVALANGDVYSFGGNLAGQLGLGDTDARLVPTRITGLLSPAVAVAAGVEHSLVALASGDVYSFGGNDFGQLGHGDTNPRLVPAKIAGVTGTVLAAGDFHSLILANGEVYSFGGNWAGQLGLGDTDARLIPTRITGLPNPALAVAAGSLYSLTIAP